MTVDSKDASEQAAAAAGALNAAEAQYRLASSTMARYEKLHELQAISDLAMDQTKNQYELASAQLSQAQAALARAENNLGFTSLTADRKRRGGKHALRSGSGGRRRDAGRSYRG